jgi:hypothetical protein
MRVTVEITPIKDSAPNLKLDDDTPASMSGGQQRGRPNVLMLAVEFPWILAPRDTVIKLNDGQVSDSTVSVSLARKQ